MADQSARRNIEDWAQDLPASFIECRTMGHRWAPHTAVWDKEARSYYVTHECDRCTTQRRAWWSRAGEISSTSYSYPDGYLSKEVGYIDVDGRGVLRTEYLTRVFNASRGAKRAS